MQMALPGDLNRLFETASECGFEETGKNPAELLNTPGIALVIPSLNPDERLFTLAETLAGKFPGPVVIVDDGSSSGSSASVFERISALDCTLLHHPVNSGKGTALKTGFRYCLEHFPALSGIVTADGDGQHSVEDILLCAEILREHPHNLILGCRNLAGKDIPFKSRIGNWISLKVYRLLIHLNVSDTQTGLRGIPAAFAEKLLECPGTRFEFETNMLIRSAGFPVLEFPIQTIFLDRNRETHFRPFRDSLRIYTAVLRGMIFREGPMPSDRRAASGR